MNYTRTLLKVLYRNNRFCNKTYPLRNSTTYASISKKEKEPFQDVLPGVIDTLTSNTKFAELSELGNWMKEVLEYNLAGGKQFRGLTAVIAYEMLEKPERITEESLKLARIMGWCVEMAQAYFIMLDDMIDGSVTRRGMPCWYRKPDIGLSAINDSILVYAAMFQILKTYLAKSSQYVNIVNLFNDIILYTSMGQHLDLSTGLKDRNNYSLFTIERYNTIIKYKTAYYTFVFPVRLALFLADISDPVLHKKAEEISLNIGRLFQIQDDYIDCYSDEKVSGKVGTDIQERKCSWLAVRALERCNKAQRIVFTSCYGSSEPAHIERIKRLYDELGLPQLYAEEERQSYETIINKINVLPKELSPALFQTLVSMIYKRKH